MAATQEHRPFAVTTPLGGDVLLLLRMDGSEALSQLFCYNLVLLSLDHSISISDVLGKHMTVRAETRKDGVRHFDGIVSHFSYQGSHGKYARYEASLRPWLWFLTRSADCRIFQGDSSVDIAKKIFGDHGFADFDPTKITAPTAREYCTQYRESAFDFLSRLFEHDGIYYFFQHEPGKHKLVLADGAKCHATVPNYAEIPFFPEGSAGSSEADRLLDWSVTQTLETGAFAHTDYDFTKPKAKLETRSVISREHAQAALEVFDYPGRYAETGPGETLARIRIEELQASYEVAHGSGTIRGLGAGSLFTLSEHPRASLNKGYLVTSANYVLSNPEYETGHGGATEPVFNAWITAIAEKSTYRPPRVTRKQRVQGPQTATVTGEGSDVWTDEYGRIKVHFHWDHKGKTDATSSTWIRVSQNWAGKNWGGMFLPHIGQEVIVDFLEGDPDQPIVTGRVYNQDNMPPLDLPAGKLKSIIRDNYGNQIIFDATPADEHIEIYSPHHESRIELGRSIRLISQQGFHCEAKADFFETITGTKAGIHLGAKVTGTVGISADAMIGFKLGLHWGGKVDVFKGTSASYTWGDKLEFSKGYKVEISAASNIKHCKKEFLQRTEAYALIDAKEHVTLNGGAGDNALINLTTDEINLDYGEDDPKQESDADKEAKLVDQAVQAMKAQAATWAAAFAVAAAGASLAEGIFTRTSDAQGNDPDRDRWATLTGAGGILAGGAGLLGLAAMWRRRADGMTPSMIAVLTEGESKDKQDNTYSRVRLVKDGVKIVTYEKKAPKPDVFETSGEGFILVKHSGDILIKSVKAGIKAESKTLLEIKSDAAITITGVGITIDAGTGDLSLKGANVNADATSGYKITAPQAKEN